MIKKRDFRKTKRNLKKTIDGRSNLVSSPDFSIEELGSLKKEIDLLVVLFMKEGNDLIEEEKNGEEIEDTKEILETFGQIYQTLIREYDALKDSSSIKSIQSVLDTQNEKVLERLNEFSGQISALESRIDRIELSPKDTPLFLKDVTLTKPKLDPQAKEFDPYVQSVPSTSKLAPEVVRAEPQNQYLDVAGFILRHGLISDRKFKFHGDPINYVEFVRHFNTCYADKISDPDILLTCLFDLLEGKALQAVKGYRLIPSADALPKVLETLKSRFGNPRRVQEAMRDKLMSSKRLKDDVDCLSEFLSDLNYYKVTSEYLSVSDIVSPRFVANVIERLPFRLRDLFLDQLASRNLLNRKECWIDELITFVGKRLSILESDLVRNRTHQTQDKPDKSRKPQSKMFFASSNSGHENATSTDCDSSVCSFRNEPKCASKIVKRNVSECFYCSKAGHLIYSCYKFIVESLEKRIKFASDKNLCFSCLRFAHGNSRCPVRSSPGLPQCRKNHHALLCSCPSEGKDMSSKPIHDTENETFCKKVSVGINQSDDAVGVRLHVFPIVISNECGD